METIQEGKQFKGGNYSRKHGNVKIEMAKSDWEFWKSRNFVMIRRFVWQTGSIMNTPDI